MSAAGLYRSASVEEMPLRRAAAHDYGDEEEFAGRSGRGLKLRFSDRIVPRTLWGKIAAGCALVLAAGAAVAAAVEVRSFLLHDARFVVPDEAAIEISGVNHLTRAQLLSIFGEDVDRNIFRVPLEERRAELERVPWVEHATVMRLLPDHLRVAIVERTPVAFVRQGTQIGLVDASGALFDLPGPEMVAAGGGNAPRYSFPVITGISAADPASTRAARMKIYMAFMAARWTRPRRRFRASSARSTSRIPTMCAPWSRMRAAICWCTSAATGSSSATTHSSSTWRSGARSIPTLPAPTCAMSGRSCWG